MTEKRFTASAKCEWVSPVVLAPKPEGSWRFCINYLRLNSVTIRDTYSFPRMDEYIDSLGETIIFTTLGANYGYFQVPINDADKNKTTFPCQSGTYRFKRMTFGLINAQATFQRTLDILFGVFQCNSCL